MARRRPVWLLAIVPVAAALVVALVVAGPGERSGGPAPSGRSQDRAASVPVRADAPPESPGTPGTGTAGFAQSRQGAAAAAIAYLGVLPSLVAAGPGEREAALTAMAAPGSPEVFTATLAGLALLDGALAQARAALPGARLLVREVPVSYSLAAYDSSRARVEVWSVGVVLIEGRTDATEVWSTNTAELAWDGGNWRVWAWSRTPGPVPAPSTDSPTPPSAVLAGVATWEDIAYAPAP